MASAAPATSQQLMSGADILVKSLVDHGVEVLFAYPGGASMPLHQALTRYCDRLRTILPRHEQGGGFAAQGNPDHLTFADDVGERLRNLITEQAVRTRSRSGNGDVGDGEGRFGREGALLGHTASLLSRLVWLSPAISFGTASSATTPALPTQETRSAITPRRNG